MEDRGWICDRHMEQVNHPQRAHTPAATPDPQPAVGERKSKRRRRRAASPLSILWLLVLLTLTGCSFHRASSLDWGSLHHETNLDLEVDPRELLDAPRRPTQDP